MRTEFDEKLKSGSESSKEENPDDKQQMYTAEEMDALKNDVVSIIMYKIEVNEVNPHNELLWWQVFEHIDKEAALQYAYEKYWAKNQLNRETMRWTWRLINRKMVMTKLDRENLINKFKSWVTN